MKNYDKLIGQTLLRYKPKMEKNIKISNCFLHVFRKMKRNIVTEEEINECMEKIKEIEKG